MDLRSWFSMDPNTSKTQTGFAITMLHQRTVLCLYPSSWWQTQWWWWSSPLPPLPPTGRMIYIDWLIEGFLINEFTQLSNTVRSRHCTWGPRNNSQYFFLYWTQIEQGIGFAGHNMFHKLAHRWKHLCSFHSRPHGTILSLAGLADDNWRHLPIPL